MSDSTKKHQIEIETLRNDATRGVFMDPEASLLANLIENQIEIDHSCGGNGTCGTCRVQVVQGLENFSEVDDLEAEMRSERNFEVNERLSCQSYLKGPAKIRIP